MADEIIKPDKSIDLDIPVLDWSNVTKEKIVLFCVSLITLMVIYKPNDNKMLWFFTLLPIIIIWAYIVAFIREYNLAVWGGETPYYKYIEDIFIFIILIMIPKLYIYIDKKQGGLPTLTGTARQLFKL